MNKSARNLMETTLLHQLDETATRGKKAGLSKIHIRKVLEGDATRWVANNAGALGVKPGTPDLDEAIRVAMSIVDDVVSAELS